VYRHESQDCSYLPSRRMLPYYPDFIERRPLGEILLLFGISI
jgi:hypothetical protein